MDDLAFIRGLADQHKDAVGFIPAVGLAEYLHDGDYILQRDAHGKRVGYLLHGKPTGGGLLTVAQMVIDYDYRQHGHGMDVMRVLIARAQQANCRVIKITTADDLFPALALWSAAGFERTHTLPALNTRRRTKGVYLLDLWPTLFGKEAA